MRLIAFILLCAVLALSLASCKHCPIVPPILKIRYVVPVFACPVPDDLHLTPITPEILADETLKMKTLNENIQTLTRTEMAWRTLYKTCIDMTLQEYSKETTDTNTYNSTTADPVETVTP